MPPSSHHFGVMGIGQVTFYTTRSTQTLIFKYWTPQKIRKVMMHLMPCFIIKAQLINVLYCNIDSNDIFPHTFNHRLCKTKCDDVSDSQYTMSYFNHRLCKTKCDDVSDSQYTMSYFNHRLCKTKSGNLFQSQILSCTKY